MSTSKIIPFAPGTDFNAIVNGATAFLQQQGYNAVPNIMGPGNAVIRVNKDKEGIKDVVGLGLESTAMLMVNGNAVNVNIEHVWTNKIIALVVGWIFCWIPFVTGIIGLVNQNKLGEDISAAVMAACANPGGYQQPPYQPPYQQ